MSNKFIATSTYQINNEIVPVISPFRQTIKMS